MKIRLDIDGDGKVHEERIASAAERRELIGLATFFQPVLDAVRQQGRLWHDLTGHDSDDRSS